MRWIFSTIFFVYFITLWNPTTITAQLNYKESHWNIPGHPDRPCRAEDGYHRCVKSFTNSQNRTWRLDYCVLRSNPYEICDDFPYFNCTDDEIKSTDYRADDTRQRCYQRSADVFGDRYILCHSDEFRCKVSNRCIPRSWVQDGFPGCAILYELLFNGEDGDDSDEQEFLQNCDSETEVRCHGNSTRCITRQMVIDGNVDCPNGTDEISPLTCHNDTEFLCTSDRRCILRRYVNDNFSDCTNGTDENVQNFTCIDQLEFTCKHNRCIPRKWVGNGVEDCIGGEDETEVLSNCFDDEFGCLDQSRCLQKKYLCDAVQNCHDGSDEIELCKTPTMFRSKHSQVLIPWSEVLGEKIPFGLGSYSFQLQTEYSLMFGFKCYTKVKTSETSNKGYRASVKLRTVPQFYMQQNNSICYDNEDNCYDEQGRFICARCFDETIISTSQICDGFIDCRDLSDECTCEDSRVMELCEEVYPKFSSRDITERNKFDFDVLCNGSSELKGGIDEKFCFKEVMNFNQTTTKLHHKSENITCSQSSFHQMNASYCDGRLECPHWEDECASDCLDSKLTDHSQHDKAIEEKSFRMCFPFLVPAPQVLPSLPPELQMLQPPPPPGVFVFNTTTSDSLNTNERLLEAGNKKQDFRAETTCQYILLMMPPNQNILSTDSTHKCALKGEYARLDFLCSIKGVECPWLFTCKSDRTKKIEINKKCDYNFDCQDQSDEMNCSTETHFYCTQGHPLFIPTSKVEDGRSDCEDRSDECKETAFSSTTEMIKSGFLRYYLWITSVCIIVTNAIVIRKHFRKMKQKQIISNKSLTYWSTVLLINLAFSDAIFGITLLVLGIKSQQFSGKYCTHDLEWRSGTTCNMIGIFTVISSQTSMNILVLITGLRFYTTFNPFKSNQLSKKFMLFFTLLSWLVSILIAVIPFWNKEFVSSVYMDSNLFFKDQLVNRSHVEDYIRRTTVLLSTSDQYDGVETDSFDVYSLNNWFFNTAQGRTNYPNRHISVKGNFGFYSNSSVCFPNLYSQDSPAAEYSLFIIFYNLLCIIFISVAYLIIFLRARNSKRRVQSCVRNSDDVQSNKMMVRIMFIILTDMICWIPIIFMSFISYFGYKLPAIVHPLSSIVFLPINSFINPVIYSRIHKSIKKRMTKQFGWLCRKCQSREIENTPPTVEMQRIRQPAT